MRRWLVAGGLVEGPQGLLLVRNRRRDGSFDWSTPGGVIEAGESTSAGLTREVAEETGIRVTGWQGPVYEVEAEAADLGWHLRVEVYRAAAFTGEVDVCDPDGIVVEARFVPSVELPGLVSTCPRWVREPLTEWLDERWSAQRSFGYRLHGADRSSIRVSRL